MKVYSDLVHTLLLTMGITAVGKILWDWLKSGRVNKNDFVLKDNCHDKRVECCLPQLKQRISILEERTVNEKELVIEIKKDFKAMRSEIQRQSVNLGEIKINIKSLLDRRKWKERR